MAKNIPIWPGSSSFFPGDTPFGTYDSETQFQSDIESKKKGGVHRPIFSPIFSRKSVSKIKPSKVHLMVNPYSGKKK